MAVGDIYEAVQTWRTGLASGDIDNVLHFTVLSEAPSITDRNIADMIATGLFEALSANLNARVSDNLTFSNIAVIGITNPLFRFDYPQSLVGRSSSPLVSIRSAPVVTKRSDVRGRRFNGRMYLFPPTESDVLDGSLVNDFISAANDYLAAIREIEDVAVGSVQMSVYSRTQSEQQGRPIATLVSDLIVRSVLGTIRGRRRVS